MNRCLMVCYYFPPGGGVGVQRSLKFAKYLPQCGWAPSIVTTDTPIGVPYDAQLLEQVPSAATVHRIQAWFSTAQFVEANRSFWASACSAALLVPDPLIPWVPPAIEIGKRIIEREKIDVLYSTSPPNSSHFVAGWLKRRYKIPWVADFRDAWLTDPDRNRSLHNRIRLKTVEKWQEAWVIRNADRIIVVSDPIKRDFLERYPWLEPARVYVITNGYDPDDFQGIEYEAHDTFNFTFTGSISKQHRGPEPLLAGARKLLEYHPECAGQFKLVLVGPYAREQADLPAAYGIGHLVQFAGQVSYRNALIHQVNADANVLIYAGSEDARAAQMMSGKIFDYLGAGRPVLAIAPAETAVAKLVRDLKIGLAVAPNAPEAIGEAMYALLMQANSGASKNEQLYAFRRSELTRNLAEVFRSAANSTSSFV